MTTLVYITREEWEKMNPHDREVIKEILRKYGILVTHELSDRDVETLLVNYLKKLVEQRGLELWFTMYDGYICTKDPLVRMVLKKLGYREGCITFRCDDLKAGITNILSKVSDYIHIIARVKDKISEVIANSVAESLKPK